MNPKTKIFLITFISIFSVIHSIEEPKNDSLYNDTNSEEEKPSQTFHGIYVEEEYSAVYDYYDSEDEMISIEYNRNALEGETTPQYDTTTLEAEETTPKAEETTPKAEETTPKAEETTAQFDRTFLKEITPKCNRTALEHAGLNSTINERIDEYVEDICQTFFSRIVTNDNKLPHHTLVEKLNWMINYNLNLSFVIMNCNVNMSHIELRNLMGLHQSIFTYIHERPVYISGFALDLNNSASINSTIGSIIAKTEKFFWNNCNIFVVGLNYTGNINRHQVHRDSNERLKNDLELSCPVDLSDVKRYANPGVDCDDNSRRYYRAFLGREESIRLYNETALKPIDLNLTTYQRIDKYVEDICHTMLNIFNTNDSKFKNYTLAEELNWISRYNHLLFPFVLTCNVNVSHVELRNLIGRFQSIHINVNNNPFYIMGFAPDFANSSSVNFDVEWILTKAEKYVQTGGSLNIIGLNYTGYKNEYQVRRDFSDQFNDNLKPCAVDRFDLMTSEALDFFYCGDHSVIRILNPFVFTRAANHSRYYTDREMKIMRSIRYPEAAQPSEDYEIDGDYEGRSDDTDNKPEELYENYNRATLVSLGQIQTGVGREIQYKFMNSIQDGPIR